MGLIILTLLGLKYLPGWVKLVWLFQPWELGYFHALKGNRICVYTPNDTPKPAYIDIYPRVNLVDDILMVETEGGCISLKDWLME